MNYSNIRTAHIEKDNDIDFMTCSVCGADLKHAMIIDGVVFGMDCGATFLGWKSHAAATIDRKLAQIQKVEKQFRHIQKSTYSSAILKRRSASGLAKLLELSDVYSPDIIERVFAAIGGK